jgi:hypothetical protein
VLVYTIVGLRRAKHICPAERDKALFPKTHNCANNAIFALLVRGTYFTPASFFGKNKLKCITDYGKAFGDVRVILYVAGFLSVRS